MRRGQKAEPTLACGTIRPTREHGTTGPYLTHFGHFRQQHRKGKRMILDIGMITFLPKAGHNGDRYSIVTL